MPAIPISLITGFLGSGKTSFLMHFLDSFSKERKIAVIQNEFSSVGVDGQTVTQHGGAYRLLEINNGSVFCVCLLGNFIDSLAAFIDANSPDEIIMEASGMSDPVSIGQIFQSPKLRNKIYLLHTWAIVDARNFQKVKSLRLRLEHQIRIADTVLLNKTDLNERGIDEIQNQIKKINPYAAIIQSKYGKITFKENKKTVRFFPAEESKDSLKPDLQSVIIKSSKIITTEKLREFIDAIKGDFIRLKGYVCTGKDKKTFIQLTFDDCTFEEAEWFAGITELVGIGIFHESKTTPENTKTTVRYDKEI